MTAALIPAGYLYKSVAPRPDWAGSECGVTGIHS